MFILPRPRSPLVLVICLAVAAIAGACGSSTKSTFPPGSKDAASEPTEAGKLGGGGLEGGSITGTLVISPIKPTIVVNYGTQTPTVTFKVTSEGRSVPAVFSVDLGQIAAIGSTSGVLVPSGKVGGLADVTATYGGKSVSTTIDVTLQLVDNGAPPGFDAGGGTGGNGGVGGSGPGGPLASAAKAVLMGAPVTDSGLTWLYPYDKTVWPQGLLAPLLQWQPGAVGNYDGIYIHLQEKGFDYKGFFAKPATPFINHPILQTVWDALSYSNQGDPVSVSLVFSSGGKAYGPLQETWTIAQGLLTGTVYYNSYGTALVQNYCCISGTNTLFGGATLAIKHGATSPSLVAGANGGLPQCRVCHSVAARGATLVTQHGDSYDVSSAYALTAGNAETAMPTTGEFAFSAISPDGTFLFTNTGALPGITPNPTSELFAIPTGMAIAATGLPAGLGAATPVFSPDGKHVAFNYYSSDKASLASLDFQESNSAFSNLQTLYTPAAGTRELFPAFLPTNDAVIFEHEVAGATDGSFASTWMGARGELWWVDLKTHTAAALTNVNGAAYLPTGPMNHATDATLDYEPTVNPVASGGYAWVVFTSRRLYGNVATQEPFLSDPRNYDPSMSATTKKLWVAAIDLNAKPGSDPSHPAFYLPAQELLACNSRGYWVVDPCEKDGQSCVTGNQCCGGVCEATGGGLVCGSQASGCSAVGNKCTTAADCCNASSGIQCIDGFCSVPSPP